MANIMMLAGFVIMTGVALVYMGILRVNMGEGMLLSAASIILALFLSVYFAGTFRYGMWSLYLLAGIGMVYLVIRLKRRTPGKQILPGWPVWLVLAGLFVLWLVIYHNDMIQHIDEWHLWAALVRYMQQKDRLPMGTDFITGSSQKYIASSLFITFFQLLGGYNEANMYVASGLLTFTGMLLPFAGAKKEEWKKILFYTMIVYLACFSMYLYATKNLYVDLPVIGWSGGMAGWWLSREKEKKNLILIPAAVLVLYFTKMSSGLLMALYMTGFMAVHHFLIEKRYLYQKGAVKKINRITVLLAVGMLLASAGLIAATGQLHTQQKTMVVNGQETEETIYLLGDRELPRGMSQKLAFNSVSGEKVKKTAVTFLIRAVSHPMAVKSNLKLPFIPVMIGLLVLLFLYGKWNEQETEVVFYRNYMILMALSYCVILYFSFVFMFTYNLSITVRGCSRYFSTCAMFWFLIIMSLHLHNRKAHALLGKRQKYLLCFLTAGFGLGLNQNFIPNVTAFQKEKVTGYEDITETRRQYEKIASILQEGDKVYFIDQTEEDKIMSESEYVTSPVLYYLDIQVNNYTNTPWRFFKNGCNIWLEDETYPTLNYLPAILSAGGYTYLWIYRVDEYLTDALPKVMNSSEQIKTGLYQVLYEDENIAGMQYVSDLN